MKGLLKYVYIVTQEGGICCLLTVLFCTVTPAPVPQLGLFDLEVSIHYRKKEMVKMTLNTPKLQLHYNSEALEYDTFKLCFPSTDGLLDHKQV